MAFGVGEALGLAGGVLGFLGDNRRSQDARGFLDPELMRESLRIAKAGYTLPDGSRYFFDDGTGQWKWDLTPQQQGIFRSDQRLQELFGEDQLAGQQRQEDIRRAQGETLGAAGQVLSQLQEPSPYTEEGEYAKLVNAALNANERSYDRLRNDIGRVQARTKGQTGPRIFAELGREQAADLRQGMLDARAAAGPRAESLNTQRTNRLGSQFPTLFGIGADRAVQPFTASPFSQQAAGLAEAGSKGASTAGYLTGRNALGAANVASGLRNPFDLLGGIAGEFRDIASRTSPNIPGDRRASGNTFEGSNFNDFASYGKYGGWYV